MIAVVILFAVAALLLILGAAVHYGHAYFLISGYNTATPEEQARVNTQGLGRVVWYMCLILAMLLGGVGILALMGHFLGFLALLLILPIVLVSMWQSQKYDGNACDENGHVRRQNRVTLIAVLAIPTLITIGVLALVLYSARLPAVTLSDGALSVSGLYHETIALSDIRSFELLDKMPAVKSKRSGTDIGSRQMGSFELRDGEEAQLYVDASLPPFLRITEKDGSVTILTAGTADKTRALAEALAAGR